MDKGQKLHLALLVALLAAMVGVIVMLGQFYAQTAELTTLVVPAEILGCNTDDDCGLTNQIGCCPCEASGGQGAVNKHKRAQLKEFLRTACTDAVPCVEVNACRDDVHARCSKGRCGLVVRN